VWSLKDLLDKRNEIIVYVNLNDIDLNGIHSTVTFPELSISTYAGNSAQKTQVTDFVVFVVLFQFTHFHDGGGLYVLRRPVCLVLFYPKM